MWRKQNLLGQTSTPGKNNIRRQTCAPGKQQYLHINIYLSIGDISIRFVPVYTLRLWLRQGLLIIGQRQTRPKRWMRNNPGGCWIFACYDRSVTFVGASSYILNLFNRNVLYLIITFSGNFEMSCRLVSIMTFKIGVIVWKTMLIPFAISRKYRAEGGGGLFSINQWRGSTS